MGKTREEIKNMKKGTDRCARPAGAYPARALYCVQYGQSQSAQPVTLQRPTVTRTIATCCRERGAANHQGGLRGGSAEDAELGIRPNPLRAALASLYGRTGVAQVGKENIRQFEKWKSEFGSQ
jgi:hypothetical protein